MRLHRFCVTWSHIWTIFCPANKWRPRGRRHIHDGRVTMNQLKEAEKKASQLVQDARKGGFRCGADGGHMLLHNHQSFPPQCVRVRAPCHSTRRPHEGGENRGGANHFCVPGRDGGRVPEQTGHGTHAAVLRSPTLCCDVSFSPTLVPPHRHSKRARVALLATPCSRPQAPKSPT